jgi:hypothetical protein
MDILDRLRLSVTRGHEPTDEDAIDAAAEIERLRDGLRRIKDQDYDMDYSPEGYADAVLTGDEPQKE